MEDEGQLHVGGHHRVLADLADLSGQLMGVQEVHVAPSDGDSVADVLHLETLVCLDPDDGDRRSVAPWRCCRSENERSILRS